MSSVRLSAESLKKFRNVLSVYRNSTRMNKWSSGEAGSKRLNAVESKLSAYDASNIDRVVFLKDMAAFAYTAYKASWTKSSDSLSAQILVFVANELKMKKNENKKMRSFPYARPLYVTEVESDKDFFKRVNEAINPTPPAVKKFLASTGHDPILRCYAGIPPTKAQLEAKISADKASLRQGHSSTFRTSPF